MSFTLAASLCSYDTGFLLLMLLEEPLGFSGVDMFYYDSGKVL